MGEAGIEKQRSHPSPSMEVVWKTGALATFKNGLCAHYVPGALCPKISFRPPAVLPSTAGGDMEAHGGPVTCLGLQS